MTSQDSNTGTLRHTRTLSVQSFGPNSLRWTSFEKLRRTLALPVVHRIVSVFIGFGICIICCFSCLKLCRASRVEVVQPVERPSVFIVPMPSEDNVFRPPRYSTTDFTEFPPPYSEVPPCMAFYSSLRRKLMNHT
ncbi:transmembrane protein 92 [Arapaima gigas]